MLIILRCAKSALGMVIRVRSKRRIRVERSPMDSIIPIGRRPGDEASS